ncbi:MAG TPA: DUF2849 domain-containing protein [Hyphomicrobiales bacterium]|nr:DUF2849 domain-containing protein [Hyphomicrobiales bacterium]
MAKQSAFKIVTANHLLEGHSVFLSEDGWTADHRKSRIAHGADEATTLEALGRVDEDANYVVGVYLVDVSLDGEGQPEPIHYREKMRVRARPSFWPDAVRTQTRPTVRNPQKEDWHVSL